MGTQSFPNKAKCTQNQALKEITRGKLRLRRVHPIAQAADLFYVVSDAGRPLAGAARVQLQQAVTGAAMDRLGAMEILVRVVETGSFSAASRQLNVGQPAVSKAIAQLEEHLGVRLLLRSTKGLTATEAGKLFYERAKRTIAEADEAEFVARAASAGLTGRLRVSMTITFARLHIIPRLKEFLDQHPEIEIDIMMDDANVALIEEGIDLAIRMGSLADSAFTGRRIGQSRRLVLGTPGYIEKFGRPSTPGDLAKHQVFLIANRGDPPMCRFRRGLDEVSVSVGGRLRVNTGEGVRAAVLAGLGLGVGSEWLFSNEIRSAALVEVVQDWRLAPMDIWAVFTTGRRVGAKARAFADFVERVLKELLIDLPSPG